MKKSILVISSANVDILLRTTAFPKPGETLIYDGAVEYLPGGKGANSARAVKSLGADSIFVCRLGEDNNGKKLLDIYKNEGIDTRFITLDHWKPTGMAAVITSNGQNSIVVYPGANYSLDSGTVEEAFTAYPDGALVQMEIPDEAIIAAGRFAAESGTKLVVDAGPAKPELNFALMNGGIDVFTPNETECEAYTGVYPENRETALKACIALEKMTGAKNIVLKLGERGAFAYDGVYSRIIAPYRVKAVDSTGAGDVFSAALAIKRAEGEKLFDAVQYANAAGAASVLKMGAYAPTEAEVKAIIDAQPMA